MADLTAPRAYGQSGLPLAVFWQRHYLQSIQVQAHDAPTGNWVTLREYRFTYGTYIPADESNKRLRVLTTVQEWVPQGSGWASLPATSFSYQGYQNKAWCNCSGSQWNEARFYYPRLSQIDNGYGGVITAQYATPDDGYRHAHNYRVSHRETKDRGTTVRQVDYSYPSLKADRCYDNNDDRVCEFFDDGNQWDFSGGKLVGYKWSTETLKDGGGTPVAITEHDFWLKTKTSPSPTFALGREVETRSKTAGGTTLRTVQHTYVDDTTNRPAGVHFIYLAQADTYAGDTTADHAQTTYNYDLAYGNLTRVVEYGSDAGGDERTTHYLYYPKDDGTTYIVDRVARETVYTGEHLNDDSSGVVARTRYRYDGQTCLGAPTEGKLTAVDRWNGGSGSPGDCYAAAFDTTVYGYDSYGNRTSTTDPRNNTTTTTYDSPFQVFPIQETNALNQTTTTQYYGVNGSSATDTGAFFGQVASVTDPNNATTSYQYDVFGRLTQVIRPGDSTSYPTVQFSYTDSTPFRVQRDQREWSGSSGVITAYRFYDGLGRPIQTRQELPNNQQAVQHTTYNAQGKVAEEYIPYAVTASSGYTPLDSAKPKTTYTYDALGRLTQLTHPDGRTVDTGYNGWQTTVVDENDHQKVQTQDGYGRLVKVEEYTGTGGGSDPYTLYATTTYAYNVLDRLTDVWDAGSNGGNHTQMEYDPLGRKTSMTDPDMGAWSYAYDAAGNLTSQTDARNCTTSFTYDALNRLTGKTYSGCPTTPAVSYAYDEAGHGYGIGQRTSMSDGSGSTSWTYDARGRLTQETKTIDGVAYTVSYDYRADDRRYKVVYPDGEDVRTQYDAAGRPYRLWNTAWPTNIFVDDTTYNAQGQFKTLKYTSGLTTHFGYYGYNGWGIGDGDDAPNQSWANVHVGRLVGVSGAASASFTYDGDGKLVKRVVNNQQTTVYVGDLYEKNIDTGQVTKYYTLGGRRVAVRQAGTLYWLLVDHPSAGSGQAWGPAWCWWMGTGTSGRSSGTTRSVRNGTPARVTSPLIGASPGSGGMVQ